MNTLFSSIGKKLQIAVSGIFLIVFLLFHLINNLMLFSGSENFNNMVHFLESIKPIIRVMEFGLLLLLLLHTVNAIKLTIENKKLSSSYAVNARNQVSSLNSRTMAVSGSIILIFIFIHLAYIWWTYQTHNFLNAHETYYDVILRNNIGYLNHLPTAAFYILAIICISFHLKHGFQSALKTLGILSKNKGLYLLGLLIWGIIPAGFILIVFSIQMGIIK